MARLYKNQWEWLSQILLSTKIVECNHFLRNTVVVEHLGDGSRHHWRTAEIVFDFFGLLMILQIVAIDKKLIEIIVFL